ncbi:tetratricopeptide repeat protein [Streptomyces caniferus]|uniref:ATP-binding protein n=1 Tax=Streptomyces caniferus TaxID=285557 RepID=UPI0034082A65
MHAGAPRPVPPGTQTARAEHGGSVYQAARDLHITRYESAEAAPVTALHTLPRDIGGFTGRDEELRKLAESADAAAGRARVIAIHTLDGMPGVGKTALAVHAAHLLAAGFPDGRLFVRLHAHTPGQRPVTAAAALATLLTGIGVPPQGIPDDLDARAGLWRDRLAGRRLLLVLDDAAGQEQLEPLLPNSPGCLVLITSRRRLVALDGARPLALDVLPPDAAATLFTRLIPRGVAAAETATVAELVRLCGHLPLAITLLAGRLAHHPSWTLCQLAAEFADAQDQLEPFAAGDRAVAGAFDLSYRDLAPDRRQFLRRLGLHPGADTDAHAAAALGGVPLAEARRHLDALYLDHLLDEPSPGRYRAHDLVRAYARRLVAEDPQEDRDQAVDRLLDHYRRLAEACDRHLNRYWHRETQPAEPLATALAPAHRDQALDRLRTEQANLAACAHHALAASRLPAAVGLVRAMAAYLRQEGPWDEAIALHRLAATAAGHSGDHLAEAHALRQQGILCSLAGDYPAALTTQQQALRLFRRYGDRTGQAAVLYQLGIIDMLNGRSRDAACRQREALALYEAAGDATGRADALNGLGTIQRQAGDIADALRSHGRALDLYRGLGDRLGQANALHGLGAVQGHLDDLDAALESHRHALRIYRDLSNRLGEAHALRYLGVVQTRKENFDAAVETYQQALVIYRGLGNRFGEAGTLYDLGVTLRRSGAYRAAMAVQRAGLGIRRALGEVFGEAHSLRELGRLQVMTRHPSIGLTTLYRALALYRSEPQPLLEAATLHGIGIAHGEVGDHQAALDTQRAALDLYRAQGDRRGQADALYRLGLTLRLTGDPAAARASLHEALALHRDLGNEPGVADTLAALDAVETATPRPPAPPRTPPRPRP